jgi:hypothetical protein
MGRNQDRNDWHYRFEEGRLILNVPPPPGLRDGIAGRIMAGRDLTMNGRIAIAFDLDDGVRHKHGNAEMVERWVEDFKRGMASAGIDTSGIRILYFEASPQAVETLNYLLGNDDRCARLWKEIEARRLEEVEALENSDGPIGPRTP